MQSPRIKFSILIPLVFLLMASRCDDTIELEGNERAEIRFQVVGSNNEPLAGIPVLNSYRQLGNPENDQDPLGQGQSNAQGNVSFITLIHDTRNNVGVFGNPTHSSVNYSFTADEAKSNDYIIDLGEVQLRELADLTLTLNRRTLAGDVSYTVTYTSRYCDTSSELIDSCYGEIVDSNTLLDQQSQTVIEVRTLLNTDVVVTYGPSGGTVTDTVTISVNSTDQSNEISF